MATPRPTAGGDRGRQLHTVDVQRFTTGLNFTLRGGGVLMLNYKYWLLPTGFDNLGISGVRWAAAF